MKALLSSIVCLLLTALALVPQAAAVEVASSGDPVKTNVGENLHARFSNVATIDGQSIDLHAQILSQTTSKKNDFWQGAPYALPGDFCFSFSDGVPGEERSATVRWTFYLGGTNTPVSVSGLILTIDDLDDGSGRTESLETSDAVGYTVDAASLLTVSAANGTVAVDAAGAGSQDPGNPESAVRLHMRTASSFTFTYHVTHGSAPSSAFHHDGAGNFTFSDPVYESIPPLALPQIYFTYHIGNDGKNASKTLFRNVAPSSCKWDSSYAPFVTDPNVDAGIVYSPDGLIAESSAIMVPPGGVRFTLRTMPTGRTGLVENEATITPAATQGGEDPIIARSSIYLGAATSNAPPVVDLDGVAASEPLPPDLSTLFSNGNTTLAGGTTVSTSVFGMGTATPTGSVSGSGVSIVEVDAEFYDPTNTFNNYAVFRLQFDRPVIFSGAFGLYDIDWSQRGSVFGSLAGVIVPPDSLTALNGNTVETTGDFGVLPTGISSGATIPILRATGAGADYTKDGEATFTSAEVDSLYFVWNTYHDYGPGSDSSVLLEHDGALTATPVGDSDYEVEYISAAVHVASFESEISDADDSDMGSASIVLSNAKPGDGLYVGAIAASISSNIDTSVPGVITLSLSGTALKDDYARAIESVTFSNSLSDRDTTPRVIEVTVNDGQSDSNTAVTTISVAAQ